MSALGLIDKKLIEKSKNWYRLCLIFSKIVLTTLIINPFMKDASEALSSFDFSNIKIYLILLVIIVIYIITSKAIDHLEGRFYSKVREDKDYRRKIFGIDKFIEGSWFVITKNSERKIVEYSLVDFSFVNDDWKVDGQIFEGSPELEFIGHFNSQVSKFFDQTKEYKYSFKRVSNYETDAGFKNGESEGAGTYQFILRDGEIVELNGSYFDPVKNDNHILIGFRLGHELETSEEYTNLTKKDKVEHLKCIYNM